MISGHLWPKGQSGALQFPERVSHYFPSGVGRDSQMPLSLLVALKLGFGPWPGPRGTSWFPPAEGAAVLVSADGPVAGHLGQSGPGGTSWSELEVLCLGEGAAGWAGDGFDVSRFLLGPSLEHIHPVTFLTGSPPPLPPLSLMDRVALEPLAAT